MHCLARRDRGIAMMNVIKHYCDVLLSYVELITHLCVAAAALKHSQTLLREMCPI